jgi:hypothetical protein
MNILDTHSAFAGDLSTKLISEACSFRVGVCIQIYYNKVKEKCTVKPTEGEPTSQ